MRTSLKFLVSQKEKISDKFLALAVFYSGMLGLGPQKQDTTKVWDSFKSTCDWWGYTYLRVVITRTGCRKMY